MRWDVEWKDASGGQGTALHPQGGSAPLTRRVCIRLLTARLHDVFCQNECLKCVAFQRYFVLICSGFEIGFNLGYGSTSLLDEGRQTGSEFVETFFFAV